MSKKTSMKFPPSAIEVLKAALDKNNAAYNFTFRDQNGFEVETQMNYDGNFNEFLTTLANEMNELDFPQKPGVLTFVRNIELVSVSFDHYIAQEGLEAKANPSPLWKELPMVTIYVPEYDHIIQIAEGSGCNLSEEDMAQGFVDYIDYYQYNAHELLESEEDGGQIDKKEYLRDTYNSLEEAIPEVLEFVYDKKDVAYTVLKKA